MRKGPDAFYIEGEVPGLTNLNHVICEFIGNQTLIVRGTINPTIPFPGEVEPPTALRGSTAIRYLNLNVTNINLDAVLPIWKLRVRHIGKFERSFTFESRIKLSELKISLEAGMLLIVLHHYP